MFLSALPEVSDDSVFALFLIGAFNGFFLLTLLLPLRLFDPLVYLRLTDNGLGFGFQLWFKVLLPGVASGVCELVFATDLKIQRIAYDEFHAVGLAADFETIDIGSALAIRATVNSFQAETFSGESWGAA